MRNARHPLFVHILLCLAMTCLGAPSPRITKLIVCVDAPEMVTGPGSVVVVDSSKQPKVQQLFEQLSDPQSFKGLDSTQTHVLVGQPFLYVSVVWDNGRKTVLSSSSVIFEEGAKDVPEVDRLIRDVLKLLGVTSEQVDIARRRSERSEIVDDPVVELGK